MRVIFSLNSAAVRFGHSEPPSPIPVEIALPVKLPGVPDVVAPRKIAWSGHYHIETTRRTDAEIIAEVNRVQIHHEKKCARIDGFQSVIGSTFLVGSETFKVADVLIRERGADVELYVNAVDAAGRMPQSMPMIRIYGTVDDVPDDGTIIGMLGAQLITERVKKQADSDQVARLQALFGG